LAAQRIGLRFAAAFSDRFGKVREQHGEPQPQNNLEFKANTPAAGRKIAYQDHRCQRRDDLKHEHDRVFHQQPGIELDEGRAHRRHDDL
jgi:hypothetical protein